MSTTTNTFPAFQPLGIGQLLDQALRLYRQNFWRFIGIFALVQVPLMLIQTAIAALTTSNMLETFGADPNTVDPTQILSSFLPNWAANMFIGVLTFLLVQGVATAALTQSIADGRVGISTGILDSYRKIRPVWLKLVGALLLLGLLSIGFFIWFLIPCVGWISGMGLLVTCWAIGQIIAPIVVIERQRPAAALRRAWDLIRRRFWWVLGFLAILMMFSFLIVSGPAMLVSGGLGALLGKPRDITQMTVVPTIISSLVSLVTSLLYMPIQLTAATLMYFDLRVRTEGLDLATDLQRATGAAIELGVVDGQAPQLSKGPIITSKEVGNFVLLTIIAGVLWGILWAVLMLFSFLMVGLGSGF